MQSKVIPWSIGILVFTVVGVLYAFFTLQQYANSTIKIQQETIVTLPVGVDRAGLERFLLEKKVISQSKLFLALFQFDHQLAKFKAGTYRLTPGMTIRQILLLFCSGKEAQFSIRFIEGTTLKEWLVELDKAPYLQHTLQGKNEHEVAQQLKYGDHVNAEGWLYPDTYWYTANSTDISILLRANQAMETILNKIWQGREKNLPYNSPIDLLIMASIIEKETGLTVEKGKVASVFINRLRKKMRLQSDPTVIYGLGKQYTGKLTRKALEEATPYNTYQITGLPPTPICMPSMTSLISAAHPDDTPYFYFVADGYGKHVFTTKLQEHNRAVDNYLKVLRQKREQR